jgi:hypothetical protein
MDFPAAEDMAAIGMAFSSSSPAARPTLARLEEGGAKFMSWCDRLLSSISSASSSYSLYKVEYARGAGCFFGAAAEPSAMLSDRAILRVLLTEVTLRLPDSCACRINARRLRADAAPIAVLGLSAQAMATETLDGVFAAADAAPNGDAGIAGVQGAALRKPVRGTSMPGDCSKGLRSLGL